MMQNALPSVKSHAGRRRLDYARIFRQNNGDFDVANKETRPTMDQFGEHRKFPHNNQKIVMPAHIKIGTGSDDEVARIHFKYDSNTGKYLIGHCGEHLPTASGR